MVDQLINEVVQMPGALPLLSFTLSELYLKYLGDRTRNNRALTKDDYEELGRVVGAITKRANQEYDLLVTEDPAYKDTVRLVMLRMISLQGGKLARRQVSKSELIYPDKEENKRVEKVVKRFSEARLIVEGSNSQGEPYVEPAHDALVQGWDKLLKWKEQEQGNLPLLRRLTPAAEEWNEKQKARYLWNSNQYLDKLKELLHSENNCFNKVEAEFVRRSVNRKKVNSRGRWSGAFVVMGVLSIIIITVLALIGQRNALLQAILVEARSANTLFVTDKKFDALVTAVKAGKQLQKINIRPHQILNWTKKVLIESSLDLREYNHL